MKQLLDEADLLQARQHPLTRHPAPASAAATAVQRQTVRAVCLSVWRSLSTLAPSTHLQKWAGQAPGSGVPRVKHG